VAKLSDVIFADLRPVLLALQSGAGLLLLIACVNVSSLLLVRSEGRKREMAVRGALGASRIRLIRQFATEGVLLVVASSVPGILVARATMQLLQGMISQDVAGHMSIFRPLSPYV
jgi:ABC-type antimicrobial peptide transport system permease subunit